MISGVVGDMGPYVTLALVGFLPNEIWRLFGVVVARGLNEGSELLVWVRAVATAILAGIISQLVLMPPGALANVPFVLRVTAIVVGFLAFVLARRSIFIGVLTGEVVLVATTFTWGS